MSHLKLTSANLTDSVTCPTSKSYAARALIIAALSEESVTLTQLPIANDTKDLIQNLKAIGLDIIHGENNQKLTITKSLSTTLQ